MTDDKVYTYKDGRTVPIGPHPLAALKPGTTMYRIVVLEEKLKLFGVAIEQLQSVAEELLHRIADIENGRL